MQHPHDRLPRRLAPRIQQPDHPTQQRRTTAPASSRSHQILDGAMTQPQSRIAHHHQIENTQVPRGGEQRLRRRRHRQAVDQLSGRPRRVAGDEEAPSMRDRVALAQGGEHRMRHCGRQPPLPDLSRRQVGERRIGRQDLPPRPQLVGQSPHGRYVQPVREPGPAGPSPATPDRLDCRRHIDHGESLRTPGPDHPLSPTSVDTARPVRESVDKQLSASDRFSAIRASYADSCVRSARRAYLYDAVMTTAGADRPFVFVSYAHEDKALCPAWARPVRH